MRSQRKQTAGKSCEEKGRSLLCSCPTKASGEVTIPEHISVKIGGKTGLSPAMLIGALMKKWNFEHQSSD